MATTDPIIVPQNDLIKSDHAFMDWLRKLVTVLNSVISSLLNLTPGTLVGRGSASGIGPGETITLGAGLTMTGTVLSAGAGLTDFTQNLGTAQAGTFDITGLSGLTAGKNVVVVQTAQAIASKGNARDEFEMSDIQLTGYVVDAATIRVYWNADDIVVGTYAFAYAVS